MRRFPRHPSSIPIELETQQQGPLGCIRMDNVGTGGIACAVERPLPVGSVVRLRIPLIWPDYHGQGVVVWCRPESGGYEVGIEFDADEAFKSKMVQQLCQIEEYRQRMRAGGRELDVEQAASEWIASHAEEFARTFEAPPPADARRPAPVPGR